MAKSPTTASTRSTKTTRPSARCRLSCRSAGRKARATEILAAANAALAQNSSEYWCEQMRAAGILNERVNDYEQLLAHPQTEVNGTFTWVEQPAVGRVPHPNVPGPKPHAADDARSHAPRIGEHTRAVLADLGYASSEVQALLDQAAVFEPTASVQ